MTLMAVILILAAAVGWVKNLIKLSECDFEEPYKAEVVHAVGLVPVVGMVTGYLDVGK